MSLVQNISQRIPQFHKNVTNMSAKRQQNRLTSRIQAAFGNNKDKNIGPKIDIRVKADFCHRRNTRNHIFFKRNQSSDNRSHGFGVKN